MKNNFKFQTRLHCNYLPFDIANIKFEKIEGVQFNILHTTHTLSDSTTYQNFALEITFDTVPNKPSNNYLIVRILHYLQNYSAEITDFFTQTISIFPHRKTIKNNITFDSCTYFKHPETIFDPTDTFVTEISYNQYLSIF